jgi:hypothetical protein
LKTMKSFLILPLLLLGFSEASCPSGCSGHGTCGVDDIVSVNCFGTTKSIEFFFLTFIVVHLLPRLGSGW